MPRHIPNGHQCSGLDRHRWLRQLQQLHQQVIVVDRERRRSGGCPDHLTVCCASAVPAPDVSSVTATDNCSAVTVSWLSDTITNQTCPSRYTVLRIYQATDALRQQRHLHPDDYGR